MREGLHYFSPKGTPFYNGFHLVGKRDWTKGQRVPAPVLGEWEGKRQFYNGDPPARLALPVLVGSAECLELGEAPGLAIIPDRSAFCGKILPAACYAPDDDLRAATNVLDCQFATVSAEIIGVAYTDLPAALLAAQELLGPAATVTAFDEPDPLLPDGVIAVIGTTTIVWLTGSTNFQQRAIQGFYLGTLPVNQGRYSTTPLYESAALAVAAQIAAAGGAFATRIVLAGHSYGGAVCMVLAARIRLANPLRNVEVMTLGAPAPGDARLFDLLDPLTQAHYANARDPIPFMPPSGLTLDAVSLLIGIPLTLVWPTFKKPKHVKKITQDGEFVAAGGEGLPDDLVITLSSLIAAVVSAPRFKDHAIEWYRYYLCLACGCVPRPCLPPAVQSVGFDFELEALEFVQSLTPFSETYSRAPLTVGGPDQWFALEGGFERVRIQTTVDDDGNYGDFTVSYFFRDGSTIFARFDWTFTAAEMTMPIETAELPSMFSFDPLDSVTSLVHLKIMPTLV